MGFYDRAQQRLGGGGGGFGDRARQRLQPDPEGEMTVGEPEVIKSPGGEDGFLPTTMDALFAGAQGVMHGWGDEFAGLRGPEYEQAARDRLALAQTRSPVASRIAGAVGQGAEDLLLAPARLGGMALGALSGGISGAGEAEEGERGEGAAEGAGYGAAFGFGGDMLGKAAGWAGNTAYPWLRGKLQNLSDEARNAALGGTANDFQKLARTNGLDYVEHGPAQAVKEQGLTNRLWPQSPRGYADRAEAAMGREGSAQAAALAEADQALGTHVVTDDLARGLERRGAGARDATTEGLAEQQRMDQMAELLRQERGPMLPPSELNAQKSMYYDRGYKQQGISDSTGSLGAEANRMAGSEAREQLLDALNNAPPGVKGRYEQASENYGEAATVRDMARNKAAALQAPVSGAGFFGTLMSPATRTLQKYGPDLAANMTQLGADAAGGLGTASAMTGNAIDAITRGGAGAVGRAQVEPNVTDTALGALRTDRKLLGQYAGRIAEAAGSPDPGAVSALIARLIQTDEEFRTRVLPQLRAAAGGGYP